MSRPAMTFTESVQVCTRSAHEKAESSPFINDLLSGRSNVRSYVALLSALLPVYATLERTVRSHNQEASIALFDHRRLDRAGRIEADLRGFGQRVDACSSGLATDRYVQAIIEAAQSPARLLAHHYTRYLGDLAGGQAIARCMRSHYELPAELLTFYDFSDLGDVVHYRRRYKSLLDLVPWSEAEREDFIDEAQTAFALNAALFDELADCDARADRPAAGGFLVAELAHGPR